MTDKNDWQDIPLDHKDDWQDVPHNGNDISNLESQLRGAGSGLTMGFGDELLGANQAIANAAFGSDKFSDLLDNYRKYRDEQRSKNSAAEKANPAAYMAGDILGGVAPALLSGGASAVGTLGEVGAEQAAKQLALAGVKQGAVSALGHSNADLTEGDVLGAAKDTAVGAGLGAGLGVAIPAAAKVLGKGASAVGNYVEDKAPELVKKGAAAYDLAKKGINVVGDKAAGALDNDATTAAQDVIGAFKEQYKGGSTKVGQALKSVPDTQDFSTQMTKIEDTLKNSNMLPDDVNKIQNELNLYKKMTTTEKVESGADEALAKMQSLIDKAKSGASALGADAQFSPVQNVDNKFLQTVQTKKVGDEVLDSSLVPQEGTGLTKAQDAMKLKIARLQAQSNQLGEQVKISDPIFDKESNSLISTVTSLGKNGEPVAKTLTQAVPKDATINVPTFGDKLSSTVHQVDIPADKIIQESSESFRNMNLQELNNVKKELSSLISGNKLNSQSKSILSGINDELDTALTGSMDKTNKALYNQGNTDIHNVYNAGNLLPAVDPTNAFTKDMDIGLKGTLLSSSTKNKDSVERALGYGTELDDLLKNKVQQLPIRADLAKTVKGEGGMFGGFVNGKGAAVRTGEALGQAAKAMAPVKDFTKNIINMDDNALNAISNKFANSDNEGIKGLGTTLNRALTDSTKRDRLLWSLSQQPAFRQAITDHLSQQNSDSGQ